MVKFMRTVYMKDCFENNVVIQYMLYAVAEEIEIEKNTIQYKL